MLYCLEKRNTPGNPAQMILSSGFGIIDDFMCNRCFSLAMFTSYRGAVKTNILMPPGDSDQVRLDSERLDPRTMRCPEREKVSVLLLASNFASFEGSKV